MVSENGHGIRLYTYKAVVSREIINVSAAEATADGRGRAACYISITPPLFIVSRNNEHIKHFSISY